MTSKMNPEVKAQWTAALRSGEYAQGRSQLSKNGEYCCLGVLCDLAVKAEVIPAPVRSDDMDDVYGTEGNDLYLPAEVMEWAGIEDYNPGVELDGLPGGVQWGSPLEGVDSNGYAYEGIAALSNMNDGGTPFALIADIIDQQL
jgi:hypothetical protein